jgi:hypothetical protein
LSYRRAWIKPCNWTRSPSPAPSNTMTYASNPLTHILKIPSTARPNTPENPPGIIGPVSWHFEGYRAPKSSDDRAGGPSR